MVSVMKERKQLRLKGWDYSTPAYYFITICTQDKKKLFPVGAAPCGRLDLAGDLAERWLKKLPEKFPQVLLDKYVVMPNHIHFIIRITPPGETGGHMGPPLQRVVGWYKTMSTNEWVRLVREGKLSSFDKHLWQRSYYDHIIRDEADYLRIWRYIDTNPAKWTEDCYYIP